MKYLSFFNGKGGVGKTTLAILAASFFAYAKNLKVRVLDLESHDYRINPFRKLDLERLKTPGTPLYSYAERNQMPSPENYYTIEEGDQFVMGFVDVLAKEKETASYDLTILDFPAHYNDNLPVHALAERGLLDCVYVPMRVEQQERRSACITGLGLASCGVMVKLLWNDIDADIVKRGAPLDEAEEEVSFLKERGLDYSPVRIKHFRKASQATDRHCFVRSTICWPDKYVRMWCPELIDLFEEISKELQV